MKAPKNVTISKEELTVPLIDQYYFETKDKIEGLCRLLDAEIDGKLIIFCRTKKVLMIWLLHWEAAVIWLKVYMAI